MGFTYNNDKKFCSAHVAIAYVSVYITMSSLLLSCYLRKFSGNWIHGLTTSQNLSTKFGCHPFTQGPCLAIKSVFVLFLVHE